MSDHLRIRIDRNSRARDVYKLLRKELSEDEQCTDCIADKGIKIKDINHDMMLFCKTIGHTKIRYFYDRVEISKCGKMTVMEL